MRRRYFKLWPAIYIPTSTPIATTIIESETIISIVVENTPNVPTIDEGLRIISRATTKHKNSNEEWVVKMRGVILFYFAKNHGAIPSLGSTKVFKVKFEFKG